MDEQPLDNPSHADHPFVRAGLLHELDVVKMLGCSWSTWVSDYRDKIEGTTAPDGRWYSRENLVDWWTDSMDCACSE